MKSDQSGLSLLEVLIGAGIMAGIALMMAEMTVNTSRAQKGAFQNADFLSLTNQLQIALSSTVSCTKALQNQVMDPSLTSASTARNNVVVNGISSPLFSPNQVMGGIKLTSLSLLVKPNTPPVTVGTLTEYEAELQVSADKVGLPSYGAPTKTASVPLKVAIDSSKKIVSCTGTGGVIANCPTGRLLASDGQGGLQCSLANLPNCLAGQALIADGVGGFTCANIPQPTPPPSCNGTPSGGTITRPCNSGDIPSCICGSIGPVTGTVSTTCVYGVWLPPQASCVSNCNVCPDPSGAGGA